MSVPETQAVCQPARKKLEDKWAYAWTKKQPLELIREYFGEKVSLYFDWLGKFERLWFLSKIFLHSGHYTTMLWIPGFCGMMMVVSQIYTSVYTGSSDNPWVPLYCVFLALWGRLGTMGASQQHVGMSGVAFLETWKMEEESKKLQWYTSEFEDEVRFLP